MAEHHPDYPPSSFPGFSACPQFRRASGINSAMEGGTKDHELLNKFLNGAAVVFPDAETEAKIEWAAGCIKRISPVIFRSEYKLSLIDTDLNEITFGTADVLAGHPNPKVIDYKSGFPGKSYKAQLELYAAAWMDEIGADSCDCVLVYGAAKTFTWWTVSYHEAHANTMRIIESVKRGDPARPCEFCEWCEKRVSCESVNAVAVKVATEYAGLDLAEYHASQIADPVQMGKALAVAEVLKDWCESVKHHAKELARGGATIPGYALKDGSEKREILDILSAYKVAGMSAEEFLGCCSVSVAELEKKVAAQLGNKTVTKAAKQELANRLGNLIEYKRGDMILKKEK